MSSARPPASSCTAHIEAGSLHANQTLGRVAAVLDLLSAEMGETTRPTNDQHREWTEVLSWIAGVVRREACDLTDALAQEAEDPSPSRSMGTSQ